jgi:hypothetical protein
MALHMRSSAKWTGRRLRPAIARGGAALFLAAIAPLTAGAQSAPDGADDPAAAPPVSAPIEDVLPNSNMQPTPRQHIQFILEEHGYDIVLPDLEDHGNATVLLDPALVPTPRQRMQFLLEEHGYELVLAPDWGE